MPRALRAWLISPSEKNSVKRGEMFIISPGSNRGEELNSTNFFNLAGCEVTYSPLN